MNFKNFSIIILCFWATSSFAQNINGKINSDKGEAIAFANVSVLNSSVGTMADKDAHFNLSLPNGKYTIVVSFVGYATQTQAVQIEKGKSATINFTLIEQSRQLDEVVVTSEKREEKLQKTPIAISVLNQQQIKNYRIWDVRDLTAVAPNLFVIEHAGSTGANFVNVRGIMGFTPEQAVATYVDGVYQYDYFSAPSQYLDVERIEVLRGPQGTLYGRNSLSGVVNIITKKPSNTTNGQVELNIGNFGQQRYSAVINTALIKDKLFANASFMYSQRGAVFKNQGKDYDNQYGQAFNIGLKYLANRKLSFDFNVKGNFSKDYGAYPWQNVTNIDSLIKSAGAYNVAFSTPNIEQRSNINTSLTVRYSANKFNLISISSYNKYQQNYPGNFDADYSSANFYSGNVTYLNGQNNFSQEVRISSNEDKNKINWLGGIYAFSQKYDKISTFNYDADAIPTPYSTVTTNPVNNTGISLFGQLGYTLSPKWHITLGGRIDNEKRTLSQYVDSVRNNTTTRITPTDNYNNSFSKFTPKITLSYQAIETQMLYASYAQGYRVGGFNAGQATDRIVYNPENSDNFLL
jgi:iron complex outermembrane recepter protein